MRIVFMGSAELACPCLEAVAGQVVAVVTQPDRPKGRELKPAPPPVKQLAGKLGLPVLQPVRLREATDQIRAYRPDIIIVVAYGQMLPKTVLDIPARGCVNVHASLLPRWRGAAPIQHAILAGDRETGVTTMFINEQLDAGDIVLQRSEPIRDDDTTATLHDRLAKMGAELLVETLALDPMPRHRQDESQVTYAKKLAKEDGRIDWSRPAVEIERAVRAFNPWPGTFTMAGDLMVKVWKAEVAGDGSLRVLEVQPAGGKRMSYEAFLRGHGGGALKLG
jgi:methionyl-tRNA formyltransferase